MEFDRTIHSFIIFKLPEGHCIYKMLDKMLGRHFFQHSFDCWPKTTALRGAILSMYILKISGKLVYKGICNQSIFEFTRVIFPSHDFETFDQFCEENGFTKIFNFLHEFYFGF